MGQRGYLAIVLTSGTIRVGDLVTVGEVEFEAIPFDLKARIAWHLERQTKAVPVTTLVHDVGLSVSYCRAMPRILGQIPGAREKVTFGGAAPSKRALGTGSLEFGP